MKEVYKIMRKKEKESVEVGERQRKPRRESGGRNRGDRQNVIMNCQI